MELIIKELIASYGPTGIICATAIYFFWRMLEEAKSHKAEQAAMVTTYKDDNKMLLSIIKDNTKAMEHLAVLIEERTQRLLHHDK